MTILFNACKKIKPTNRLFGARIMAPSHPRGRPYSDADARWWAAECDGKARASAGPARPAVATAHDRRIDKCYREWAQTDAVCRGLDGYSPAYEAEHEHGELAEMFGSRMGEMIGH